MFDEEKFGPKLWPSSALILMRIGFTLAGMGVMLLFQDGASFYPASLLLAGFLIAAASEVWRHLWFKRYSSK